MRGAFLAGGSVTDPEKRYHLELATPHRSVSREMFSVLLDMGFSPKETQRSGNSLLYFKKADLIADFFTSLGAPVAAMNVMTAKVDKEMRNTVTRQINCDSANADKTVAAAQEQMAAIRRIVRSYGLDALGAFEGCGAAAHYQPRGEPCGPGKAFLPGGDEKLPVPQA